MKRIPDYMIFTKEYMHVIQNSNRFNAYGNFLDGFRNCGDQDLRVLLIADRPENDELYPVDASKLAASVEILCNDYGIEIPEWVMDEKYILKEPYYGFTQIPEYRQLLKETALPEFARRNLYLGDNCMDRA